MDPIPDDISEVPVPRQAQGHLAEVTEEYGGFSAYEPERMTHSEMPWRKVRGGLPPDAPSARRSSTRA